MAKQLACIDSSPALLEKIGTKDRGISLLSVVCMTCRSYIQTAAAIQSRQRAIRTAFNSSSKQRAIRTAFTAIQSREFSSPVPSIGQTRGSSPAQFPASSDQAPRPQRVNPPVSSTFEPAKFQPNHVCYTLGKPLFV